MLIDLIIFALIAGVGGMTIGAIIPLLFKNVSDKFNALMMVFAGGIMLSITVFDLIPSSIAVSKEAMGTDSDFLPLLYTFGFVLVGVLVLLLISRIIRIQEKKKAKAHEAYSTKEKKAYRFYLVGIVLLISIAFHDVPEGLAIGANYAMGTAKGISMAILIGIHNIPEGLASALPLKRSNMKAYKISLISAGVGLVTVVGAIIGFYMGQINLYVDGAILAVTGGSMLFLVFHDMLKEAFNEDNVIIPTLVCIGSMFIGLLIISLV